MNHLFYFDSGFFLCYKENGIMMNEQNPKYDKSPEECKHPYKIWVREKSKEGWICEGCGRFISYKELGSDYSFSMKYYLNEEVDKKQKK